MKKTRSRNSSIRKKILKILEKPMGVSDLKKALPEVSSFGTIAYHLNELTKEKLIKQEKQEHKRGQPTLYFLNSSTDKKSFKDILKEIESRQKLIKEETLIFLEKNPYSNDKQIIKHLKTKINDFEEDTGDGDVLTGILLNCEEIVNRVYLLTEKGKQYLKENKNKK